MRRLTLTLACLALALAGCGPKEAETTDNPTTTETTTKSSTDPEAKSTELTEDVVVGEWTMKNTQGNTEVDAVIVIKEDGTFTNEGTLYSETPGEDATTKITASYSIAGKWKLVGDTIETTPDEVDAKIDDLTIEAKDPANQKALDDQKAEATKKAEQQMKDSINQPSKSKVKSHSPDKLVLESPDGDELEYVRKS
ncbi:MAG TPA: hypothetical protein PLL78_00215 [Fimbriimonadaceae bacterium]|nr:hypothetical protein [Fimbriimonadaceae bacterium]HRJ95084.1 hypothetical protein [Fimbriimonadaceae bacterium]